MAPAAGWNANIACEISGVLEYPVIKTVKPFEFRAAVALTITGGPAFTWICLLGAGEGVTSVPPDVKLAVIVIEPATVPVCNAAVGIVNKALVELAGMVNVSVRDPVANVTSPVSAPVAGRNVSVSCPLEIHDRAVAVLA